MAQISLETTSKQSPEKVIQQAKETFIEQYGLTLKEEADCCIRAEGGGGFIYIQAEPQDDKTKVVLEGREWSHQLQSFMKKISA